MDRLRAGLSRTREQIGGGLGGLTSLFSRRKIDEELLEELETTLLMADCGVEATQHLLNPDAAGHSFFTDLADGYDHSTYEHLAQRARSFSGETVDESRDEVQELVSLADVCTNYGIAERQGLAERVETTDDEYVLIEALATAITSGEAKMVRKIPMPFNRQFAI